MKRWYIKNNFAYTIGMCFILTNIIYFTRVMQYNDKAVIQAMVDIDQTLAKLGTTDANNTEQI